MRPTPWEGHFICHKDLLTLLDKQVRSPDPLTSKDLFAEDGIVKKRVICKICPHKTPRTGIWGNLIYAKLYRST